MKRLLFTIILSFSLCPSFVFAQEITDNHQTELEGTETNLTGYWKLNNDLLDETNNDNDLTNNNSAVFSLNVPFEGIVTTSTEPLPAGTSTQSNTNSIDLESSSSQYLSITDANQTGLDLGGAYTLEMWINLKTQISGGLEYRLFDKSNVGASKRALYIGIYDNSGTPSISINQSSNGTSWQDEILIPYTFTPGTWYHLAITFDGTNDQIKAYVNGSQTGSTYTNVISSIYNTDTNFVVGANGIATSGFLDAKIDDVRVWSDVRTGTEISNDYSIELEGTESNLVGYWKMNDSLLDETTNTNDLTNNNSALFSIDVPFEGTTSTTSVTPTSTVYYLYEGNTGSNYANSHALTTVSSTDNFIDYTYDNNGNLTSYGDWENVWDYTNRLLQSVNSTDGVTTTYQYDQSGQRVKKTENGVVSIYPNKYYTIENGTIKKHIFAGDTELASIEGTTTTYHHTDHLSGSSVETDEEGYVVEVLDYYPFGETRLDEKYTAYENDKKFTGHMYDDATDLYYMGARYQDPEIGRFVSQDPLFNDLGIDRRQFKEKYNKDQLEILTDPQQLNSYSYARNNPLKYTDPEGESILAVIAAAAYAVFEVGSTIYDIGSFARTYLNPDSTELQKQQALDWVAIGMMVPGSGKIADDVFGMGRALIKAGDNVAGLGVTKHAAKNFAERNMTKQQISNALEDGVKYMDNKTGNIMHVVGERGKGGYTIVTDASQETLVTVENFVPKISESRYTKIDNINK